MADEESDLMHASTATPTSCEASPYSLSPWSEPSPYDKSPWMLNPSSSPPPQNGLIGSIVREQGHVYSLATSGDLLYTGSDSKNIRVWKKLNEYSGFKSSSGLVKAIVILGDQIFTGHQDGKIRVWRIGSSKGKNKPAVYKRIGNLPTTRDFIASSINPKNYVEVRRHKTVLRIRHYDAVSCLSLDPQTALLYSGSWDKTLKVWRIANSKCLETIDAHDDAINSVVAGFDDLVFTGAADGTVKVWRREMQGKGVRHHLVQLLLKQENAVTALAVNASADAGLYCGSSDGLVNFWERQKAEFSHAGTLRGHKLAVLCLAAAGRLVFSGSADRTICVWRRDSGAMHTWLSVLTGHTGPVKCLAVEEDAPPAAGKCDRRWILYTGSLDKSVRVWRVAEEYTPIPAFDGYAPPVSPVVGFLERGYS